MSQQMMYQQLVRTHDFSGCTIVQICFCVFKNCNQAVKIAQSSPSFVFTNRDTSYIDCGQAGGSAALYLGSHGTTNVLRCCGLRCFGLNVQFIQYEMHNTLSPCLTDQVAAVGCGRGEGNQATIMFRLGKHVVNEYNATECRLKSVGAAFCFEPQEGSISFACVTSCSGSGVLYFGYPTQGNPTKSVQVNKLAAVNTHTDLL